MGKECECELPDNCRRPKWNASSCIPANGIGRSVLTINRKLPGPYIQVCKNDKIRVKLHNDLDSMETSIHWHGILQRGFELISLHFYYIERWKKGADKI